MSNHRITMIGGRAECQARCSCKQKSPVGPRGDVEEWVYKHQELVARVRAHLGSRNPSLKTQHAWFRAQAANPENDPADRELWCQLADEVERFLTKREPIQQESLF